MKLVQNLTEDQLNVLGVNSVNHSLELGTRTGAEVGFQIINLIMFLVVGLVIIGLMVTWLYALIDVLRRNDLKEDKILHVLLILLIPIVGVPFYFFKEGKKKWGIFTIVSYLLIPVVIILSLVAAALAY